MATPITALTPDGIAALIDHAILHPALTTADVETAIRKAAGWGAKTVCVRPSDVRLAVEITRGTRTGVCTVIGFPHGTTSTVAKAAETAQAIADGAEEIDMVLHPGRLKDGTPESDAYVREDIAAVVRAAATRPVKVIFETVYLNDEQKARACRLSCEAGAAWVKTSTGFGSPNAGGATPADVALMAASVTGGVQVKASGGVRNLDQLLAVVAAGATRIGASATGAIVEAAKARAVELGVEAIPVPAYVPAAAAQADGASKTSAAATGSNAY